MSDTDATGPGDIRTKGLPPFIKSHREIAEKTAEYLQYLNDRTLEDRKREVEYVRAVTGLSLGDIILFQMVQNKKIGWFVGVIQGFKVQYCVSDAIIAVVVSPDASLKFLNTTACHPRTHIALAAIAAVLRKKGDTEYSVHDPRAEATGGTDENIFIDF